MVMMTMMMRYTMTDTGDGSNTVCVKGECVCVYVCMYVCMCVMRL